MQTNELPIWRDAQRLLLITEETVCSFSRYHKYTLGSELGAQAMCLCCLINSALSDPRHCSLHVGELVMALDRYKLRLKRPLLRLAWRPAAIEPRI